MFAFLKEEGVFISGVILLVALIALSSYESQSDTKEGDAVVQTPVAVDTTTVESGLLRIVTSTPAALNAKTPAAAPAPLPAPQRRGEREYDDD